VDAETSFGSVSTDSGGIARDGEPAGPTRLEMALGDGGMTVRVRTSSGDIGIETVPIRSR
jgi:hypothetical protein